MDLELLILSALVFDRVYTSKVITFLKQEYFTSPGTKNIFIMINTHFEKYSSCPTIEVLAIEALNITNITAPLAKDIESNLNKLCKTEYSLDWLTDATEKFCKERAVYLAIVESIEIQDGTNPNKPVDAIPDILSKALAVSFSTDVGVQYLTSAEERYDYYNTVDTDKIPFGLKHLDNITNNGLARKTLNLIVASASTGKMQPVSEPVLTPLGWSTMGAIRPGDYVIGSAGLPIKVLAIHPQGVQDVYTVKTMDGVDIRCGKDHLWSVHTNGSKNLVTKTTQELIDSGLYNNIQKRTGKYTKSYKYALPTFVGIQGGKNIIYAYALGYFILGGRFVSDTVRVVCYKQYQQKLQELLETVLGTPAPITISGNMFYSLTDIHTKLRQYTNWNAYQLGNKHLPITTINWQNWDYNSRLELLSGILDSNFMKYNKFSCDSKDILILVQNLIRSLGGVCQPIVLSKNAGYYSSGFHASIKFVMPVCPYKLHTAWNPCNSKFRTNITSITKEDYQEEQVCITVDAEDHLYVTTGFKLTHNSIMLCHHAAKCLEQGKNVLFVTLEMSAEAISQRIDANLMQVNINTLYSGTKDAYLNKFNKIKQKTLGQLYIKEYPISTAHAGNFNALIDELAIKKSFHPDIIIIDYLNICASSTNSSNSNSYERVKCIAEQLRSLAQKRNLPVLSAIQLNRSGSGNTSPDMADIADSYALAMVADFILALVTNESLAELEQILCCQIKNRYADVGKPKKFILGLDKPKMTFYDVNVEYNDSGDKSEFIDVEGREVVISLNKNKKQVSRYIE